MAGRCPECGASLGPETSCQAIFEAFLALEFTLADYGRVHMLTVACFMIQHGHYSDAALVGIAGSLRAVLQEGVSAGELRSRAAPVVRSDRREWKITRRPGDRLLPRVAWSLTIADVAERDADPDSYCEWVERWARSTLAEMGPLLPA
jgi:hypothetical protein